MKQIMAIYDIDSSYADHFADYVNKKEKTPFIVMAFTDVAELQLYSEKHRLEILLIGANVQDEILDKINAIQIIVLTDGESASTSNRCPCIFKYQSTDRIIREVLSCYCQQPELEFVKVLGKQAKIIGIFSPVHRCLKTSFSLTMGQLLAKEHKVLYLNLEEYSGFSKLMAVEGEGNLSDLLYFYQQQRYSQARLSSLTHTWGNLDFIPPVHYPEDLCQVSGVEFAGLIDTIANDSFYEMVVVDTGPLGRQALPILEHCGEIYMPIKEDPMSTAKVEEFIKYLECCNKEKLLDKVKQIKLPYHHDFGRQENYFEELLWGELGDYTRSLMKGQLWNH